MSDDFLSRWSRRKLEVKRSEEPPAAEAPTPAADAAPAAEELSAEEIAALPPVESLTAESDIGAFLRKGVPQALRNAALRRAWALDPEIRDYVGEARDYAYDWNVPGGVPGTGPLDPGTDVARMVEDVFGRPHGPEPEVAAREAEAARADDQEARDSPSVIAGGPDGSAGEGDRSPEPEAVQSCSTDGEPVPARAKTRHGGAKPA